MTRSVPAKAQSADAVFDELLVVMAQGGDARAFERLHRRWNRRLASAALRYTGSPEAARDLSQDCWLGIWKGIGRLRDPKAFRAYAFGILHRRGADYLRGTIRSREHSARPAPESEPGEPARQGERSAIAQAFATLPPDQRLAAHLHFVEGLTLSEIAEAQAIPTGTAKSRLFHARRKLKAALSDLPEGD